MTALIDYDAGNLRSVEKALRALGDEPVITRDREILLSADRVILPGVGAYKDCMEKLNEFGLVDVIHEIAAAGIPFLGICLGMQLLFESSEEGMEENGGVPVPGLSLLKGKITRIPGGEGLKIPHMGWNSVSIAPGKKLFRDIADGSYFYFVHSFYLTAENEDDVAACTSYGVNIHAAVESGNVFGCQFHPEKSSDCGMQLLKNFLMEKRA